jgi:hypothetical protein
MAMTNLVRTPDVGYWVASKCRAPYNPAMDSCIGVLRRGELKGGCIFSDYTGPGGSVTIHVGSDETGRWATKEFVAAVFHHVFVWLDVNKLFGQVPTSAPPHVLQFNYHLGFQLEHLVKDVYPDGDMLVLSMYKHDCKFLVNRPGGHLFG